MRSVEQALGKKSRDGVLVQALPCSPGWVLFSLSLRFLLKGLSSDTTGNKSQLLGIPEYG